MHIFPRGLVGESLGDRYAVELAKLFLIQGAHAKIANHLAGPSLPFCNVRFFGLDHLASHYQRCDLCDVYLSHKRRHAEVYLSKKMLVITEDKGVYRDGSPLYGKPALRTCDLKRILMVDCCNSWG